MDGKTDVDKGGQLTKAVAALECEARGLTVKRWADGTKNAGEVHSDVKLQELIKNLKTWVEIESARMSLITPCVCCLVHICLKTV